MQLFMLCTISALVGPPGSGVEWFRYLIEQMTGIYTDSVDSPNAKPINKNDKVSDSHC